MASAGCCVGAATGCRSRSAHLETGLIAGDPTGETTLAWTVAQDLMGLYQLTDSDQSRTRANELITNLRSCPIPEIAKLGRTLYAWRTELLAHFDHPQGVQWTHREPQPQDKKH